MSPLDRIDLRILEVLQQDARLSMVELAGKVHLSRTAAMARVRQLEAAGIIAGYHAAIRWPNEERTLTAMLLLSFDARPCAPVLAFLRAQPEIRQVWSLSGQHDAIAEAVTTSTVALSALVDRLAGAPYGIRVDTRPVLDKAN